ncbi:MAG TPA: hypothetical protein VML19_17330 [Verrucomicrobiae bacterium]|nr:hypothetical protein [Verrucomicrobiae bacterium]
MRQRARTSSVGRQADQSMGPVIGKGKSSGRRYGFSLRWAAMRKLDIGPTAATDPDKTHTLPSQRFSGNCEMGLSSSSAPAAP